MPVYNVAGDNLFLVDCILVKKKQTQQRAPVINFDIRDMKCFKESKKSSSWKHLVFILKCGTTYPALHFHNGGTDLLIDELQKHLTIHRWFYAIRQMLGSIKIES